MNELTSKKLYIFYFIFSILIVWLHCNPANWGGGNITTHSKNIFFCLNNSIQSLAKSAVPFFFVASGFLFYKNLNQQNLKSSIIKKIKRYSITFIIWSLICFVVIDYLRNIELKYIPLFIITSSFDGPLWFIEVLIFLILLSPIYLKILKNKKLSTGVLTILFLLAIVIDIPKIGDSVTVNFLYPFQVYLKEAFPYYFLGAYLGTFYKDEIINEKYFSPTLSGFLVIFLILFHSQYFIGLSVNLNGFEYEILIMSQGLLLWMACSNKLFNYKKHWWYHNTYFTYVSHWILTWIFSKIFANTVVNSSLYFLLIRIITTIIVSLITILVAEGLKRLFPKIYSILIGNNLKTIK